MYAWGREDLTTRKMHGHSSWTEKSFNKIKKQRLSVCWVTWQYSPSKRFLVRLDSQQSISHSILRRLTHKNNSDSRPRRMRISKESCRFQTSNKAPIYRSRACLIHSLLVIQLMVSSKCHQFKKSLAKSRQGSKRFHRLTCWSQPQSATVWSTLTSRTRCSKTSRCSL